MKHLRNNNISYLEHFAFSGKVGMTLLFRGIIFLLHAVCPVARIPKRWNLKDTAEKLSAWDASLKKEEKDET